MSIDRFWELFHEHLEPIDQVLSARGTPIPRRHWEAAFFFLEHCIIEVSGMTKKEVVRHRMFRDIVHRSRGWYIDKYGERLVDEQDLATGMVTLFDTPFEITFPLTVTRRARRKGVTAVHFPRSVLRSEDSLAFFICPPNLDRIDPKEKASLRRRISRTVSLARRLDLHAMQADVGRDEGAALAAGIRVSLEKGVRDVCSLDSARLSSAMWEFNFAAEKALKTFLWQKSRPVPKTHDVRTLIDQAVARGLAAPPKSWGRSFPSGLDAVRYRYGESGTPTVGEATEFYRVALRLSTHCAQEFQASAIMLKLGAVVYLRPPWDDR